jgi:tRNA1Val (adenine37-N6)-methyltransferase
MPNPFFRFKQFTIFHDRCAMKVGIDGVLLGAWTPLSKPKRILDVGTGSGLISLMLAQRSMAMIDAIDIDQDAITQATVNVQNSPWSDRISLHHQSFQDFVKVNEHTFDVVVSNPPYFVNSLKNPSDRKTLARHTDSLSHLELIALSVPLLTPNGIIALILPVEEGYQCIAEAEKMGVYCKQVVEVYPKPNNQAKRLLIEFCLIQCERSTSKLTIETDIRHQYSPEFSLLARDFYLKL